ncbi:MAG: hypothetical protein FJX29_09740, partial [Alphaproteobacteria bacterium]|nr:hypothetical protein [Alphaproteobacteria bacterium]
MSVSHNPAILLQCWLSPGYPVGSYAYSHGLEWFAESGAITDESGLQQWLSGTLTHGTGRQDAIFINECYARNRIKNRKERLRAWRELAVFACASCSTQ